MPFRDADLSELEGRIGYSFRNRECLKTALRHKSALEGKEGCCNDKFEWLGDTVVGFYLADYLLSTYDKPRSWLSAMKSKWASEECLAQIARKIELDKFIVLGRGEERTGGREKGSILASALEALVGAIFVDSDSCDLTKEVLRHIFCVDGGLELVFLSVNYKSLLQTWSLKRVECLPVYETVRETSDRKMYRIAVKINDQVLAVGEGKNKKKAEQEAARKAWEKVMDEKSGVSDILCI
ncbi:MAG: ribonuclease III [Candidatus Atribacteria bacterium]|nr:ribonuclease III [Candidatus Atribacteria bacterium]